MTGAERPEGHDEREERACLVALASISGIGPATLLAVHAGAGASAAWRSLQADSVAEGSPLALAGRRNRDGGLSQLVRTSRTIDPDAVLARHEGDGQKVLVLGRRGYPVRLLGDPAPPALLFARGDPTATMGPAVAIVGTRNCTRLGRDTARLLAIELIGSGVSVVSGLALGIDGAAHLAVIEALGGADPSGPAGRPVGVVATGLDRAYPRRHRLLHDQVAGSGVLLSETPIGGDASRWRFPARNRIIAGLSDAVVIVESRSAGGSMLTAAEALERDVPVMAVPGHPTAPASAGPLDLISDGAIPVRDTTDVLVAIGRGQVLAPSRPGSAARQPQLSTMAVEVFEQLEGRARTLGELVLACPFDLETVSCALVELESTGMVVRSGAWFERSASTSNARTVVSGS